MSEYLRELAYLENLLKTGGAPVDTSGILKNGPDVGGGLYVDFLGVGVSGQITMKPDIKLSFTKGASYILQAKLVQNFRCMDVLPPHVGLQ